MKSDRSGYVFAGGGTGGHLFPGIAVAEELQVRDPASQVLFIGSEREIEREIIASSGFEHRSLPLESTSGFRARPMRSSWQFGCSVGKALQVLLECKPTALVGLGGWASVPAAWAARMLGIPIVLLEQNIVPGRATSFLSGSATQICVSFDETVSSFRRTAPVHVTGNPVRRTVSRLTASGRGSDRGVAPILLVLGGSQGATAVNDAMLGAAARLRPSLLNWRIVHQSGHDQAEAVRRRYEQLGLDAIVAPFFEDLPAWYAAAEMAVSRAGATTLAELACAGCPAVLIPYPNSIKNHQLLNAQHYQSGHAARVVEQHRDTESTAAAFSDVLRTLLEESDTRRRMGLAMRALARPAAAGEIADLLLELAYERTAYAAAS